MFKVAKLVEWENQRQPVDFIDAEEIWSTIHRAETRKSDPGVTRQLLEAIEAAAQGKALPGWAVADLLVNDDPEVEQAAFAAARQVKESIYGNRVVLFAPLYISNYCVNACTYCGYNCKNNLQRRRLTLKEIAEEVRILEAMGHKRLALEAGEDPVNCPIEYVVDAIETIYDTLQDNGAIRRVNVNIAATVIEDYEKLKAAGIGTYVLFQETYHRPTYEAVHPRGPKHCYEWHTMAMDRAMMGGIDDVGIGVLYGLYDHRFEVLATLRHVRHLEEVFGVGPHTISVPRLRPAEGVSLDNYPYLVSDADFMKLVAVLRLAVPYTGLILSTRETPKMRSTLLNLGVSQLSAGSNTGVGGYQEASRSKAKSHSGLETTPASSIADPPQFSLHDHRSLDEVVCSLAESGYLPSFCTACYRQGRTGDRFMALAKSGQIQHVCQPNALLTLQEFIMDYGNDATRQAGEQLIAKELETLSGTEVGKKLEQDLKALRCGRRDIYY